MTDRSRDRNPGGTVAENYQRFFVPAIGRPVAEDLLEVAKLQPGERVLDVACGTGVVTRLAAEGVAPGGLVAGLDPNPGMLAVARSESPPESPPESPIEWHQASAEAMPLPDEGYDVVLCQMGLQFVRDRPGALSEMRRVLKPGGRVHLSVPGPKPAPFAIMAEALGRHLGPQAAGFVDLVFSLHDPEEMAELLRSAGFREVEVEAKPKDLSLPAPEDFLWQYLHSTPIAEAAARAEAASLDALERDVCGQWQALAANGSLACRVGMTTASALK